MLTISNLNQYYGGSHILRDLTFDVPDGKVTCLLGRNGVGKTTLLRTLMGVIPAKTGSVRFGELDLTRAKSEDRARARIGFVPQGRESFAQSLADQYLVMERGEIIARGTGADMDRDNVRGLLAV